MFKKDSQDNIWLTRGNNLYLDAKNLTYTDEEGVKQLYHFQQGDRVVFRLKVNSSVTIERDFVIDFGLNKATLEIVPSDTESLMNDCSYRYEVELITATEKHYTFKENKQFTIGTKLEEHNYE